MTDSAEALTVGTDDTQDIAESTSSPPQTLEESTKDLYLDMAPLHRIADGKTIRVPRNPNFSRRDVVNAFQSAFELVGGVPRLALWANQNEGDFYKLYSRLLPSQSSSALGEANVLRIEMAIPKGPLDE